MVLRRLFGHPDVDYYLGHFDHELYEAIGLFENYLKIVQLKFSFFRRIDKWDALSIENFRSAFAGKAAGLMAKERSEGLMILKHIDKALELLNDAIGSASNIKKGSLIAIREKLWAFRASVFRLSANLQQQLEFLEKHETPEKFNSDKSVLASIINTEEQILRHDRQLTIYLESVQVGEARHVYARIMSEVEYGGVAHTNQLVGQNAIPALLVDSEEQRIRLLHLRGKTRDELLRRLGGTGGASVLVIFTTPKSPEAQVGNRNEYGREVKFRGPVPINFVAVRR